MHLPYTYTYTVQCSSYFKLDPTNLLRRLSQLIEDSLYPTRTASDKLTAFVVLQESREGLEIIGLLKLIYIKKTFG